MESYEVEDKWFEVYRYDAVLRPEDSTISLAGNLTMKNMMLAEFAGINDINVSMTGYACGASDVGTIDDAWSYIKGEAGV